MTIKMWIAENAADGTRDMAVATVQECIRRMRTHQTRVYEQDRRSAQTRNGTVCE